MEIAKTIQKPEHHGELDITHGKMDIYWNFFFENPGKSWKT
jgi:hypothetical protein